MCPNDGCDHGAVLHDINEYDDPRPTCCVDGCMCGHESAGQCTGANADRPAACHNGLGDGN